MTTPAPHAIRLPPGPPPLKPRASERVTPKFQILVAALGDEERVARGIAFNISPGGLGCYLYGPTLPDHAEVLARLSLHGRDDVLRVFARIAWIRRSPKEDAAHYGLTWLEGGDLEEIRERIPTLT